LKNNSVNVGDMDKYLDMLADGAKSADRKMVSESFKAIANIKSDKAVGVLSALKLGNPLLSQQVYQALGQIATPTAVNTLITMKNEATDVNVKNQIITILGRTGDASVIISLTEDLKNPALKANAAYAISLLSGEANEKTDGGTSSRTGRNNYGGRTGRYDDANLKGGIAPNGIMWQ
jgi:HEAT repeat protein